jgi:glycosyltransferase involved in cell wall biosynthesis
VSGPKDVVHYVPKFSPAHWGGAEETIVRVSRELEERGFRSRVWSSRAFSELADESIDGIEARRFPSFFLSRRERAAAGLGKAPLSVSLLKQLVVERQIDLLHVHTHNRMTSGLVAVARARKLPVVLSLHSQFVKLRPGWRYRFSNEFGIRHASHVTVANNSIRDSVIGLGVEPPRVTVVPYGVDTDVFTRGHGERFRSSLGVGEETLILTVGRICDVKNQAAALDVLPLIHRRFANAHWVLIGFPSDESYFENLQKQIVIRGLEATVHIIPGLPPGSRDLADAYAAADVVVIPSRHEGFPLVLLETWASGVPLVASKVGGLPEAIRHGADGLLAEPGDSGLMAQQIIDVLEKPQLADRLVREARKNLVNFAWPVIAERLAAVYEGALASRT